MSEDDIATAERLTKRRARLIPIMAVLLVAQQGTYFSSPMASGPVDHFKIAAWLVLSVALLLVLATGGGWLRSHAVRALINDETTRAHRLDSFRYGFFAAMAACVGLYFLSLYQPLGGREAIHLVMTAGLLSAMLRFGVLERHAHNFG